MGPVADRYQMPSLTRVVVGLVLAGSLPGLLLGLLALPGSTPSKALGFGTFLAIFYGVAPALVLGLPAVFVLRGVVRPSLKASAVTGAVIAGVPVAAALTISLKLSPILVAAIPLGAIGGAAFWAIALRDLRPVEGKETPPPLANDAA